MLQNFGFITGYAGYGGDIAFRQADCYCKGIDQASWNHRQNQFVDALELVGQNDNMRKGEFVVIVDGAIEDKKEYIASEQEKLLRVVIAGVFY